MKAKPQEVADCPAAAGGRAPGGGQVNPAAGGSAGTENLGEASELPSQNAALRRERHHLASQLEAALSHLRRLTIDNAELRRELEAARAITRIGRPDAAGRG